MQLIQNCFLYLRWNYRTRISQRRLPSYIQAANVETFFRIWKHRKMVRLDGAYWYEVLITPMARLYRSYHNAVWHAANALRSCRWCDHNDNINRPHDGQRHKSPRLIANQMIKLCASHDDYTCQLQACSKVRVDYNKHAPLCQAGKRFCKLLNSKSLQEW